MPATRSFKRASSPPDTPDSSSSKRIRPNPRISGDHSKPILSDAQIGDLVDWHNRSLGTLKRADQIAFAKKHIAEDLSELKDFVYVTLSFEHLSWRFVLSTEELEYLEACDEQDDEGFVIDVFGKEIEATFSELLDEVERDPVKVAQLMRLSPERVPSFIQESLDEFWVSYTFTEFYMGKRLAEIVHELGDVVKPNTKITRKGIFADSLLEAAAQKAKKAQDLNAEEMDDWREQFAEYIDEQYLEATSDDDDEGEAEYLG